MILKDILKLFFLHKIVEIPVLSPTGQGLLGIVKKDRIVEMNNSNANFSLTFEENLDKLIQKTDEVDVSSLFTSLQGTDQIPVLSTLGEVTKFDTKPNIIYMLRKKDEAPPHHNTSPSLSETRPDDDRQELLILENILVPILVTNTNKVIQFANQFFLCKFGMEKSFILNQKIDTVLTKMKIENGLEGTFSYAHTKWFYQVNYMVDLIYVVFTEIREVTQNSASLDADKLLKGKVGFKDLVESYENGLIKKVWQKTKNNIKQTSQHLGIDEKTLSYRLTKIR